MRKILISSVVLISTLSHAHSQVRQSGTVTQKHVACWTTAGVIQDCGTAASGFPSSLGVTNNGGPGICLNSDVITNPYNQFCLSVSTNSPAQITLQNFGGAPAQSIQFNINGTVSTFTTTSGSVTAGHIPNFVGAGVLGDSGLAASASVITTGSWQATPVAIGFGGTGGSTAAIARTNLGLGTLALQDASAINVTGVTLLTGLPTPLSASDATPKSYVDSVAAGLIILPSSGLATAAVLPNTPTYSNGASGVGATLTSATNTTLTVDGTSAPLNTVVLVKNQASAFQNGIYTVTQAGSGSVPWILTRATYFDQAAEMKAGSYTFISSGSTLSNTAWVLQTTVTTVGSDSLTFNLYSTTSAATTIAGNSGNFTLTQPLTNNVNTLLINATITPQGRLTLASGTPVMTASQAAITTVYYTPYAGNLVPIYDGTNFIPTAFAEVSQATTDTTKSPAAVAANSVYDVFCWVDTGPTNRCTRGPAWTNTTTRSAGTALTYVNGIALNNASITNGPSASRGTWVGTVCSDSSSRINYIFGAASSGGTAGLFCVWNAYNRVLSSSTVIDNGISYNYSSGNPIRQARGSAGNQVSFVVGAQEDSVDAKYTASFTINASSNAVKWGLGFDVTNTFSLQNNTTQAGSTSGGASIAGSNPGVWFAPIGLHTISANEQSPVGTNGFDVEGGNVLTVTVRN